MAGQQAAISGATENEAAARSPAIFRRGSSRLSPLCASGPRSMIGHSTREGHDPARRARLLEVAGCHRRYHAAMMRTVVNGALSESMRSAQDLMKHTLASCAP